MEETQLQDKCTKIENDIWNNYVDTTGNCEPIADGIVDIEQYLTAKFKILWVLKEPYDDNENGVPTGGGWHFCRDFLQSQDLYTRVGRSRATWQPIVYTTYGLLNDFLLWDDMPYIRAKLEMMNVVHSIAAINIRKLPGLTRTRDFQPIVDAYNKNKEIVLRQIDTYDPEIVIGASTLELLFPDLGISEAEIQRKGDIDIVEQPKRVLINAYHPAQTVIPRQKYVDNIITAVKNWRAKD